MTAIVFAVTWVLAIACIVSVVYDMLARRKPVQPVTPVSQEAIEERIQQAYDNGYFSGYEDCRAGFGMHPDVVGRSGLVDTEKLANYDVRVYIDGQEAQQYE